MLPITFSIQTNTLKATVVGTGNLGVENGLLLQSQQFTIAGSSTIDLGTVQQGVFGFKFILGQDSEASVLIIDASGLTVLGGANLGSGGPLPSGNTLAKFWANVTPERVTAELSGALGDWIKNNAVGAPLLVVVGFVSGGTAFAIMALSKGADLAGIFVARLAEAQKAAGILTSAEAASIKTWATVANGVLQIPSILTATSKVEKAMSAISAGTNVLAETDQVKVVVTYASDGLAKYVLALTALKK